MIILVYAKKMDVSKNKIVLGNSINCNIIKLWLENFLANRLGYDFFVK